MTSTLETFIEQFSKTSSGLTYAEVRDWFTPEREVRFWEMVDKNGPNGCWLWTGALFEFGYGRYEVGRKAQRVHRLTYMLARQRDIPAKIDERDVPNQPDAEEHMVTPVVRHLLCDNRHCCNPAHLALGSQKDNLLDEALIARPYREEQERTAKAARERQYREDRENVQAVYHCYLSHCIPFKLTTGASLN